MVPEGLLNSVEEATPIEDIVKNCLPVEDETVSKLAVWFVTPSILRVVEAT